jgi:tripartite motif-containing protein 71
MHKRFLVALLATILAGVLIPASASAQTPAYITQWGTYGNMDGQFWSPYGVAVDASGNVYVADTGNFRIQKFMSNGAYLTKWGSYGNGNGQFRGASGVAVDGRGSVYVNGNVYVADCYNHRIQVFTNSGTYLTQWGTFGTGNGQFNFPYGVAVDAGGYVYVADTDNHRIQVFTRSGVYLTQWGTSGTGDGQFNYPWGVAVDASGNVYVADYYNHRIQKFTFDGTYVTQWGTYGSGDGQFAYPQGVAVDAAGNVYGTDVNHRIQVFTNSGTYLTQWGTFGTGNGQFDVPAGVAVDGGRAYVADYNNNRIQVFDDCPGADVPATTPLTFALDPVSPNPSRGGALTVHFSLPTDAPARLDLLDVAGRRIASHDVGVGQHTLDFGAGQRLAPGLYLVRLTQGANTRTTRVAVIR